MGVIVGLLWFVFIVSALLLVMIIPLLVNWLMGKYDGFLATDIFFVLHILWMGLALAVNNPDKVVSQMGSMGVEFLGGYFLARAYVRSAGVFVKVVRLLVLVVCATLPFAVYEALTGHRPRHWREAIAAYLDAAE